MAYDKAKWHFTDSFPEDLAEEQIYVHTGFYMGWVIEKRLYSRNFLELNKNNLERFHRKEITAPELFENQGGVLSDDELNEEGQLFTNYYYENLYFDDYRNIFIKGNFFKKSLPSDYHVRNSWKNYQKIVNKINARYKEWQEFSEEDKLKYKKRFDFDKLGISDNSRAINNYFVEKYTKQLITQGFRYLKTKKKFSRNRNGQKEIFGLNISFRKGGFMIFPYLGTYDNKIEKIFKAYTKETEFLDIGIPTIVYSETKIRQENENWMNTWSTQDDESKVDTILENVIQFLEINGESFYNNCRSFEQISNLLLKHNSDKTKPLYSIRVFEGIIKGLIALGLNGNGNISNEINNYRPFIYDYYSQGKWGYEDDVKKLFDTISQDILDNKI